MEVAVDHRRETFGEGDGFGHCIAHHHTTPADDDGELGLGEHVGRGIEAGLATRTAVEDHRRRDLDVDVTVEAIARMLSWVGPISDIARSKQRAVISAIRFSLAMCS